MLVGVYLNQPLRESGLSRNLALETLGALYLCKRAIITQALDHSIIADFILCAFLLPTILLHTDNQSKVKICELFRKVLINLREKSNVYNNFKLAIMEAKSHQFLSI